MLKGIAVLVAALACSASAQSPDVKVQNPVAGPDWLLMEIYGTEVLNEPENRLPHFRLTAEGQRVTGFTGCNSMFGGYQLTNESLKFNQIGSTMMACLGPPADHEREFMKALGATRGYRLKNGVLELRDETKTIARFKKGV